MQYGIFGRTVRMGGLHIMFNMVISMALKDS
jgi:hypothetical protein